MIDNHEMPNCLTSETIQIRDALISGIDSEYINPEMIYVENNSWKTPDKFCFFDTWDFKVRINKELYINKMNDCQFNFIDAFLYRKSEKSIYWVQTHYDGVFYNKKLLDHYPEVLNRNHQKFVKLHVGLNQQQIEALKITPHNLHYKIGVIYTESSYYMVLVFFED